MSFPLSPAVAFREFDLTLAAESQLGTSASFAGVFAWGPVLEIVRLSSEDEMVKRFGKPLLSRGVDFHVASSFLSHAAPLDAVRVGNSTMRNAISGAGIVSVLNDDDYTQTDPTLASTEFLAKYVGALGNGLSVAVCNSASRFSTSLAGSWTFQTAPRGNQVGYSPQGVEVLSDFFNVGDWLVVDGIRYQVKVVFDGDAGQPIPNLTLDKIYAGVAAPSEILRVWQYAPQFGGAPTAGRVHIVVIDRNGDFSNDVGSVLEKYESLSLAAGTFADGTSSFYVDALNGSQYIRAGGADLGAVNSGTKVAKKPLTGGDDGFASLGVDDYMIGYDLFQNQETADAPLIIGGDAVSGSAVLGNYLIQNIAAVRRDSVVFLSPKLTSVVNNRGNEEKAVKADRAVLANSSYAAMDCNWKYMYDRYNDRFLWIPCNGDTAGLYARVDFDRETWFSAAGRERGVLKNVVKLAWSPNQTQRDSLYIADINPIANFPDSGPTVYGDKTLLGVNSAFSRINVRRLFITLEKIISEAARGSLFEFNDETTQRRFLNTIEPFLRDVKARRGVQDYLVVVDSRVNTPSVIDNNQFVGQIFVKPSRSINFIRLDFVAVGTAVSFDEVVGTV